MRCSAAGLPKPPEGEELEAPEVVDEPVLVEA